MIFCWKRGTSYLQRYLNVGISSSGVDTTFGSGWANQEICLEVYDGMDVITYDGTNINTRTQVIYILYKT